MPRLPLFSEEYDDLIVAVTIDKKRYEMQAVSPNEARKIRFRFYKYRTALRHSPDESRRQMSQRADLVMVTTEGSKVIFDDRRNSREAVLIREALKAGGYDPIASINKLAAEHAADSAAGLGKTASTSTSTTTNKSKDKISIEDLEPPESKSSDELKKLGYGVPDQVKKIYEE